MKNSIQDASISVRNGAFVDMKNWNISICGVPESKLTIRECYLPKGKQERCICTCDCGNTVDVPVTSLDTVLSCGCVRKTNENWGKPLTDLTGWVMKDHGYPKSKLTVIKRGPNQILASGQPVVQWECQCECGNLCLQSTAHLLKGDVMSCGCGKKVGRKKLNKYFGPFTDPNNRQYYIIEASNTGHAFFISAEDKCKIDSYTWREGVAARLDGSTTHFISADIDDHSCVLHKMIIDSRWVRFEDNNPLNNRKENLTPISWTQHMLSRGPSLVNKSGVKGVYYDATSQKWVATIIGAIIPKKSLYLGRFDEKEDAIKARLVAEAMYLGENAGQKNLFKQYGVQLPKKSK